MVDRTSCFELADDGLCCSDPSRACCCRRAAPIIAPVVESTAATAAAVSSVGSLLGVDPSGAAVQAALTFMACRKHGSFSSSTANATFQSWLSTLPLSPFFPLGLAWAALGNAVLVVCVALLHGVSVLLVYALRRGTLSSHSLYSQRDAPMTVTLREVAAALRFPSLSLSVGEFLLTGTAVCGTALVASQGADVAVGWACVAASGVFVGLWLALRRAKCFGTSRPPPRHHHHG